MKNILYIVIAVGVVVFSYPDKFASAAESIPCTNFYSKETFLQNYEKVEYVNGFLVTHLRVRDGVDSTRPWRLGFQVYGEDCTFKNSGSMGRVSLRPTTRNFSLRWVSGTRLEVWDDDTNTREPCAQCVMGIGGPLLSDPWVHTIFLETAPFKEYLELLSTSFPRANPNPDRHSSVIFLPGLQASRLYKPNINTEKRLWEPFGHTDVRELFLDENGNTLDSTIYTGEIIKAVSPTGGNIYKSFAEMMDDLVADDTIADWKALPYDWRLDLPEVVDKADMVAEILQMAKTSDTGKVTLIAHSNGGLVAKELISQLEIIGKADLIDKLVLAAVPQMGTPKALEGILHGENVGWIKGFFLPRWLTRGLGKHMQSAFNLLPTTSYFGKVIDPVIEFDPTAVSTAGFRAVYGDKIDDVYKMRDFLKGLDGRLEPAERDVISPNVVAPSFVDKSALRADEQDFWVPPAGLKVVQIVGWGMETLKGIKYTDRTKTVCDSNLSACLKQKVLDQRPQTTTDGDKSVISYSADKLGSEKWYLNLQTNNTFLRLGRDHADILEVSDSLDAISNIIKNLQVNQTQYLTPNKPTDSNIKHRLSVHSPVSIDVYDPTGSHTGLVPNPNSDFLTLEEQIPNSTYMEFGEGKYISVPDGETYNVVIKGTGLGEFDLELDGSVLYSDIPVNPKTISTITITPDGASALTLDVDGDGTIDATIPQGYTLSATSLLDILEYNVKQLTLSPRLQKRFDRKITFVRDSITKEQITNAQRRLDSLVKDIKSYVSKGIITFEQAEVLMGLINQIKLAIK